MFSILPLWKKFSEKKQTLLKKLEYHFLVESTKIENATWKTPLSEASVETYRMGSTKWTYRKERSFAKNCLLFRKCCFSLRTSYKELIWCINHLIADIHTFRKCWTFTWGWFFPVSNLKVFKSNIFDILYIMWKPKWQIFISVILYL